jgi:LPS sulfotransferase NodH
MPDTHCKFVVAGTQRTGTTLIRTSLNSHPDVSCRGEVFKLGRSPYALPDGYWAYTRASLRRRARALLAPRRSVDDFLADMYTHPGFAALGFKLMLSHYRARPYIWDSLLRHRPRIVLVHRRNHLRTLVSRRAAAATGVYHVSRTLPAKTAVASWKMKAVTLDPRTILAELDAIAAEIGDWKALAGRLDLLEVAYEDYVRDRKSENARLMRFLGVKVQDLSSDLERISPENIADAVANLAEIAPVLQKSPHAHCL